MGSVQHTSKRGSNKDGCKAANAVDERCAGKVPKLSTDIHAICVSTSIDDNADDDKDDDGNDLQQTQPVLHLTIGAHADDVSTDENDPKDQAQRPSRKVLSFIEIEYQLQGDKIGSGRNGIVEPVIPGKGKSEGVIDKAAESH